MFFFVVSQVNDIPLAHHIIFQTVQHKQGDQPKKSVSSNLVFICGPNDSQIVQLTANICKSLFNFLIGVLASCYMMMMMVTMAITIWLNFPSHKLYLCWFLLLKLYWGNNHLTTNFLWEGVRTNMQAWTKDTRTHEPAPKVLSFMLPSILIVFQQSFGDCCSSEP